MLQVEYYAVALLCFLSVFVFCFIFVYLLHFVQIYFSVNAICWM